ncbi:MAG: esterase family protein [Candidatus Sericytochromatia bacterium]|nr:esterase family protein [Candidatus Sericytochromatia bacterium]
MHTEHHKWYSPALGKEMDVKIYGHGGKPILGFPCQEGRYWDFEDRGMIKALYHQIESGRYSFYAVDSVDSQSWMNKRIHPAHRIMRHMDYDRYVTEEVVPFMRQRSHHHKFVTTGASMGGYQSANAFFRHPDAFDGLIGMSGCYSMESFLDNHMDENVYFNVPLAYLKDLNDPWYLEQYRQSQIILSVGQGKWEDPMREHTYRMGQILHAKGVPAQIDFWGHDVDHDWPWWLKQLPTFLDRMHY